MSFTDKIIAETFEKLSQKYTNIVAIYTGQQSNLEHHTRNRRQVAGNEKPVRRTGAIGKEPKACANFLIAAETIFSRDNANAAVKTEDLSTCTSKLADKVLTVTLQPTDLSIKFKQVAGTWMLFGAEKGGKSFSFPAYIYANKQFSYRCSGNFTFTDATGAFVKIKNTQFMPDFEKADHKDLAFYKDKYVYCEGFWTPGILAALFVVFLFILILLVGLSWIMDINTMDKFDDPKGKTITINTTE